MTTRGEVITRANVFYNRVFYNCINIHSHNKPSPFLPSLGTAQVKLAGDIQIYIQIYWGKENPVPKPETLKKIGHNLISLLKQPWWFHMWNGVSTKHFMRSYVTSFCCNDTALFWQLQTVLALALPCQHRRSFTLSY